VGRGVIATLGKRLQNRIRPWMVTGVAAALILGVVVFVVAHTSSYYVQFVDDLHHDVEMVVAGTDLEHIAAQDFTVLSSALAALEGNAGLLAAVIYSQDGRALAHWARHEADPIPAHTGRRGTYLDGGKLVHARSLSIDGEPLGMLYVHASLKPLYAQLLSELLIMTVIIAAIVGLASVYSSIAQGDVIWPVRKYRQLQRQVRGAQHVANAAHRAKTQFFANVTHEIRTPMNAVVGMTELLMKTPLTKKQKEYVQTIRDSGDLLLGVIDDILDLSKLEAGELQLESIDFHIDDVVEPVFDMLSYRSSAKGVPLLYRCDPAVPRHVQGDLQRLRQVLLNLVDNALKFTERGEVVVAVSADQEDPGETTLWFSVEDAGPGISPELKDRLFTPFAQSDVSTPRRYGGTGLGLTVAKRFVEMMGGSIYVDSKVGQGSIFSFTLRVKTSGAPTITEPHAALTSRRVLVIDHHPGTRESLCEYLVAEGMRAESVVTEARAISRLRRASRHDAYELAIIDANMPSASGLSLTRRIQGDSRLAATRVVLLTSIAHTLVPGLVSSMGGVRCLNKPILPRALRACVLDILAPDTTLVQPVSTPSPSARAMSDLADGVRVLIAEDNAVSQKLLLDMLEYLGLKADGVSDGVAVLEAMTHTAYDLVLLDCQMPELDGYEVAAELRRRQQTGIRLVIIAVTAHVTSADRQRCKDAGMDDYLAKPVTLDRLEAMLRIWLEADSARPPTTPAAQPFSLDGDASAWLRHGGHKNHAAFQQLTKLFVSDTTERLNALCEARLEGHIHDLARKAHALEGGCLQVGSTSMARLCSELEVAARSGQVDAVDGIINNLRGEFSRVRQTIAQIESE